MRFWLAVALASIAGLWVWVFVGILLNGNMNLIEPNKAILYAETVLMGLISVIGVVLVIWLICKSGKESDV